MVRGLAETVIYGDLVDMASVGGSWLAGIEMPLAEVGTAKVGITDQFLGAAETYHGRYTGLPYWRWLITDAIKGRLDRSPSVILDIGSGSGNSVLPCLEMFPDAKIVATDLSETLLAMLREEVSGQPAARERIALVCLDVTRAQFVESSADLVIGAAILHHLVDPAPCIQRACRALRPGGLAIFFEPFEAGNAVLRMSYERLLAEDSMHQGDQLSEQAANTLRVLIKDFSLRAGSDKSGEIYRQIDDKWLFTKLYFESVAAQIEFVSMQIDTLHAASDMFTSQTRTYLKLSHGLTDEQAAAMLPLWAWDVLRSVDAAISIELKHDLPVEARIIFRRSPLADLD
jgi:ubiquinone/menaquinone biosynthesis C-methylase UbiE